MTNARESREAEGLAWQIDVWDRMMPIYAQEVDVRFIPVVDHVLLRSALSPKMRVLDVGTGTGAAALRAAALVHTGGDVVGVDVSPLMLGIARQRSLAARVTNVTFIEGRAEALPVEDSSMDRVLASLSLMYSLDRDAAAREFARVLRSRGKLVAAFWAGPDRSDIVKFQAMAGSFAPKPPVDGVGPGAMADATPFLRALNEAGIEAKLETETLGFTFDSFEAAWDVLAGVTTARLPADRRDEAKAAVYEAMWPKGGGPRYFQNVTQFVIGEKA